MLPFPLERAASRTDKSLHDRLSRRALTGSFKKLQIDDGLMLVAMVRAARLMRPIHPGPGRPGS